MSSEPRVVVSSRATLRQALDTMARLGADEVTVIDAGETEVARIVVQGSELRELIEQGADPLQAIGIVVQGHRLGEGP